MSWGLTACEDYFIETEQSQIKNKYWKRNNETPQKKKKKKKKTKNLFPLQEQQDHDLMSNQQGIRYLHVESYTTPVHSQQILKKLHYENMPIQIQWKFHLQKLKIFR